MKTLDAKDPAESVPVSFEFAALAEQITSPVVAITRHSGEADSNPGAMLNGSAQVIGTQVRQKIVGGVAGANYTLRCQVSTPDGYAWVIAGLLPVRAA